jgi:hypothetical protein
MKISFCLSIIFLITFSQINYAQHTSKTKLDKDAGIMIGFDYGYNLVGKDMKTRFGNNLEFGSKASYMFKNSNWNLGLKASYFFGDTVKQDILTNLKDENGFIIGINGDYAQVKLRQRGFLVGAFISNIIPIGSVNERSGLRVDLGVNLMQHWIRLQDDYNTVAQFNDPYKKGYDRLTNGFALSEFIGYQYLSKNRRINLYGGLEFVQAWTKSRREYDFATQSQMLESRLDLLNGFKLGLILPIYIESQPDEIFY